MTKCELKILFSELIQLVASIVLLAAIGIMAYYYCHASDVPVVVTGYRIGTDNIVNPGELIQGVVLVKRDPARNCRTQVTMPIQDSSGRWTGNVFELMVSGDAVFAAEKKTPGEFPFSFVAPKDLALGPAIIHASASFWCSDNPWHHVFPARLNVSVPITVED